MQSKNELFFESLGLQKEFYVVAHRYLVEGLNHSGVEPTDDHLTTLLSRGLYVLTKLDLKGLDVVQGDDLARESVSMRITADEYDHVSSGFHLVAEEVERRLYFKLIEELQAKIDAGVAAGLTKLVVEHPVRGIMTVRENNELYLPSIVVDYTIAVQ